MEIEISEGCLANKCSRPTKYHLCVSWYNQFKRWFFFAGYQPVISGQQGFQGLMGVQQPPQSQSVMSNQTGTPVQSMMVSYPTMSSYQVHISGMEIVGYKVLLAQTGTMGPSLNRVVGWVVGARQSHY